MAYIELPDIPEPLLKVITEETWKVAGWTGYRTYTTTISVGDVVLMERTADDETDYRVDETSHEQAVVKEFAERLKEVLGL